MSESIANRLGSVEHKLDWLMNTMKMRAAVSSGVIDPNTGQPVPSQVFEGTMLELYQLQNTLDTLKESDGHEPPPIVKTNGSTN